MAGLPDHRHPDHHLAKAGMAAITWQKLNYLPKTGKIGCKSGASSLHTAAATSQRRAGEVPLQEPVSSGRRILFSTNHTSFHI